MTHLKNTTNGSIEITGGKLYYEVAGAGPTIVFCHAGVTDRRLWDEQWEAFAQHFRVMRFDARGFGKSDAASGPVARRQDLYELLTGLGIEKAHLVGCSMGGETIIDFALEYPEMVESLTVVNGTPSGFEMQGEPPQYLMEMFEAVGAGEVEKAAEYQARIFVDGPTRQPEQVNAEIRAKFKDMARRPIELKTFLVADGQPLNPLTPPAAQRLNEIRVPTLIISSALDHAENIRAAQVMAAEIEGAKLVTLEGCAHLPSLEKPAAFNAALGEFLNG